MTWYLTFRALCFVAFVAGVCCLVAAGVAAEEHRHRRSATWIGAAFAFAIAGCLLVGLGWTPVHP